jgi:hypothetical protein
LRENAPTIRVWPGHAAVSSLSMRTTQRIEKSEKKREMIERRTRDPDRSSY